MKTYHKIISGIWALILFSTMGFAQNSNNMFPTLEGWKLQAGDKIYVPDNLWDIINGAADSYLSYDFQRLYTAEYVDEEDKSIGVYIFEHSNPTNAFGIYSQERYTDYTFNQTGAQGFSSNNAYYFITGPYYVQINSNNNSLEGTIEKLGGLINKKLDQHNRLPQELDLFPGKGKVSFSEKYISNNFLGYDFLHSAFTANYETEGKSFQIFIINSGNESETGKMLNAYLDFVKFPEDQRNKNKYVLEDPYNGLVLLHKSGNYLFGIMGADKNTMEEFLELLKNKI
jgi:hypothetical protein